jgi:hypothetical protein
MAVIRTEKNCPSDSSTVPQGLNLHSIWQICAEQEEISAGALRIRYWFVGKISGAASVTIYVALPFGQMVILKRAQS